MTTMHGRMFGRKYIAMMGYSLIELLLVLALATVVSLRSYQVLQTGLEQYALDKTVATMRMLAQWAKAFQYQDTTGSWPANIGALKNHFGLYRAMSDLSGFGTRYELEIFDGGDRAPAVLQISTMLPRAHHARYVAHKLGYSANYSNQQVLWWHTPAVKYADVLSEFNILDAHLDLDGNSITGLRAINSNQRGYYDLRSSILKVDRVIARSLNNSYFGWVDQDKGPPLFRKNYPGSWPDYFEHYIAPDLWPRVAPIGPPIFIPS